MFNKENEQPKDDGESIQISIGNMLEFNIPPEDLRNVIQFLLQHNIAGVLPPGFSRTANGVVVKEEISFSEKPTTEEMIKLSKREFAIFLYIKNGYENERIATILGMTNHAVAVYKHRILKKLGIK